MAVVPLSKETAAKAQAYANELTTLPTKQLRQRLLAMLRDSSDGNDSAVEGGDGSGGGGDAVSGKGEVLNPKDVDRLLRKELVARLQAQHLNALTSSQQAQVQKMKEAPPSPTPSPTTFKTVAGSKAGATGTGREGQSADGTGSTPKDGGAVANEEGKQAMGASAAPTADAPRSKAKSKSLAPTTPSAAVKAAVAAPAAAAKRAAAAGELKRASGAARGGPVDEAAASTPALPTAADAPERRRSAATTGLASGATNATATGRAEELYHVVRDLR
jgi:hypothetical protein